ncbi:MAG: SDR family oxidoreductase [Acidobacteriaceae bacterium]|nr:SDR family oxidoreductase [Acidobacteriaceae bacterium]
MNEDLLKGKRAVITGGSRGIGLAIANALLSAGAKVVICGRDENALDHAVKTLKKADADLPVTATPADVAHPASVEQLFEYVDRQLGGLDILVNNAGVGRFRAAGELSIEEWNEVIGTNLSGAFYCTRAALERFGKARGGWIINISSLAGKNPFAGGAAYNASKFGLNGLSEATMLDHRSDNVRVSYIMPGSVETEFSGTRTESSGWKIAPEDIAQVVLDILKMPERTLISRVEVRPSRPQRN